MQCSDVVKKMMLTILLISCGNSSQQDSDSKNQNNNINQPLDTLAITAPFEKLIYQRIENIFDVKNKEFDAEYHSASFQLNNSISLSGKVRLRGGIRFCDRFPHLKLKFKKSTPLYQARKYKLVSHGFFPLDPTKEIIAPNCENKLSQGDRSADYQREFNIYKLAELLLDYHFKVIPMNLKYVDESSQEIVAENFGYLIEDLGDVEKRYQSNEMNIDRVHESVGWNNYEEEDLLSTAQEILAFNDLADQYEDIASANPGLNEKEVSSRLPTLNDAYMERFLEDAESMASNFESNLKSTQFSLVERMKLKTTMDAILFNKLIGNSDWAIFGMNPYHSAGYRNVKFIKKDGEIITIPYDFDLSKLVSEPDTVISELEYRISLNKTTEALQVHFGDEYVSAYKSAMIKFLETLEKNIQNHDMDLIGMDSYIKESVKNFLLALKAESLS